MGYARLQREPFHIDKVLEELRHEQVGGVTFYVGTVRGTEGDRRVDALEYEAFPEMAESTLDEVRRETIARFGLVDATCIHRLGRFRPGEAVLLVALAGRHRGETYDAVRHFMDRLKTIVPIWKREEGPEGATWILGAESRRVKA